ncbi:MAG TPA: M61 family peptidase [Bacteroidota bacterium]|nr:M61 family peptidase [Bacteroidota bacterium]
MTRRLIHFFAIASAILAPSHSLIAQGKQPGIVLSVDARESPRRLLHVKESIAVVPGPLTLVYPKWIPGEHGPTGPIADLVGIKIFAGRAAVAWRRDLEEMYEIHCDVPSGTNRVDLSFDFLLPPQGERFSSGASSTAQLVVINWNQVVLFPKGADPDEMNVSATLTLSPDWKFGSALETDREAGRAITFKPVPLAKLIDSPVVTGAHFRRVDLGTVAGAPHNLDIVSDNEAALEMNDQLVGAYRKLVLEANGLFGAHHYKHYDFLLTLSDDVAHFGLEHHQSSDDRLPERSLVDEKLRRNAAGLLPHEFVHSWNGKYRRPTGLATGDYTTPMKGDLLWVYEGLTQYLGKVLSARSGLRTPEEHREDLALLAARLDYRPGREWRPLQDCADEAQILYNAGSDWEAYRRSTDFYDESNLIWLEADAIIRQESRGAKSLDDFCKAFHGGTNSEPVVKPYAFEDVLAALSDVARYDWAGFLKVRLQSLAPHAPLGGIELSGWKLVYKNTPSSIEEAEESAHKSFDLRFSIGVVLSDEGAMVDVSPTSPAAEAGLAPGMKLVAVDGRKFSKDILLDALRGHVKDSSPLELLAANGEFYKTYRVDYHLGLRYPSLERIPSKPDLLSSIIKPVAVSPGVPPGGTGR